MDGRKDRITCTENADNLASAKQAYHTYLGAYGYGNNADFDYVQCKVTNLAGNVIPGCEDIWSETPVEE